MKYDFDEIIDRKDTNALNYDGWRQYIFKTTERESFGFTDDEFIRMWVADMDFATPPEIINAIKERLDRRILGYTKVYDKEYYNLFRDWCLRRYNWKINTKEIVLSPGIIPALNRLVPLLTEKNEGLLIHTPSYAPFLHAGEYSSRKVYFSELLRNDNNYTIDFEDLESKLKDEKLNIKLFILSNPHNPTGRVWTQNDLREVSRICSENDVWIISDEIHCDLLRKGVTHLPLSKAAPDNNKIITCMAPSKTFNLAGNLMSHLLIPDELIREEWQCKYDDFISPLSLAATMAAYSSCDAWLDQLLDYLDENFRLTDTFLKKHLPEAKFTVPEATYLAWIDISSLIPAEMDSANLSLFFATRGGVLVEGGSMFVGNGEGFIRINLACPRAVVLSGLERIKMALLETENH